MLAGSLPVPPKWCALAFSACTCHWCALALSVHPCVWSTCCSRHPHKRWYPVCAGRLCEALAYASCPSSLTAILSQGGHPPVCPIGAWFTLLSSRVVSPSVCASCSRAVRTCVCRLSTCATCSLAFVLVLSCGAPLLGLPSFSLGSRLHGRVVCRLSFASHPLLCYMHWTSVRGIGLHACPVLTRIPSYSGWAPTGVPCLCAVHSCIRSLIELHRVHFPSTRGACFRA